MPVVRTGVHVAGILALFLAVTLTVVAVGSSLGALDDFFEPPLVVRGVSVLHVGTCPDFRLEYCVIGLLYASVAFLLADKCWYRAVSLDCRVVDVRKGYGAC